MSQLQVQQYPFPDQSFQVPLSTPEICKMILNDPLQDAFLSTPTMVEDHTTIVNGLMADFEDIPSSTMVNPDDVCYGGQQQMQSYPYQFDNGYSSSSFPSSPESLMNGNHEQSMTLNNFNMCAASPADSHFSSDSGASFYNMDAPAMIKQEPCDFPAAVEEINQQQQQPCQPMAYQQQQQYIASPPQYIEQNQQQQYIPVYQQQSSDNFSVPTTVPLAYHQHQPQQMLAQAPQNILPPQAQPQQQAMQVLRLPVASVPSSTSSAAVARKRSHNGTFASTSESSTTSSASTSAPGTKKARLTKRQKQQQMDKQVEEYTQKNKDLRNQIELLERKVQFCTQFLQKYVSPIVQGRQNTWTPEVVNAVGVEAV